MRRSMWVLGAALVAGGCSTGMGRVGVPLPRQPDAGVVVVGDDADREGRSRETGGIHARSLEVPAGHYPPPGECRIWYPNRPAGHQPPPARCGALEGRVPFGAFLLYNDRAWDTEYDWRRAEARRPGSVPDVVLRIMSGLVRP